MYDQNPGWQPAKPRLSLVRLLVGWIVAAAAVRVAAVLVPGFAWRSPARPSSSPPLSPSSTRSWRRSWPHCGCRSRWWLGFLLVLLVDALAIMVADELLPEFGQVDSFGSAMLASLVIAAASIVFRSCWGRTTTTRARCAWCDGWRGARAGRTPPTSRGSSSSRSTGWRSPILRRAMRDGNAPVMARWMEEDGYRLTEWETDLSSQTGASQAGILLGSNEDIPAFRWVEKETGTMMVCSSPQDCAEIERRMSTGYRPAGRRRRQPREPAFGRGRGDDPHRQPHGGGEGRQPRLPGVLGPRGKRDPGARPVLLGGGAGVVRGDTSGQARRASSRPSRR